MPRLGFTQKIHDWVQSLLATKQFVEAVRVICAFKLVDKFQPVQVLKDYVELVRTSTRICHKRKSSEEYVKAKGEEIDALKAVTKCIVDCNLQSEFSVNALQAHIAFLVKRESGRKRSGPTAPANSMLPDPSRHEVNKVRLIASTHENQPAPSTTKVNSIPCSSSFSPLLKWPQTFAPSVRPVAPCNNYPVHNQFRTPKLVPIRGHAQFGSAGNGHGEVPHPQIGNASPYYNIHDPLWLRPL